MLYLFLWGLLGKAFGEGKGDGKGQVMDKTGGSDIKQFIKQTKMLPVFFQ